MPKTRVAPAEKGVRGHQPSPRGRCGKLCPHAWHSGFTSRSAFCTLAQVSGHPGLLGLSGPNSYSAKGAWSPLPVSPGLARE